MRHPSAAFREISRPSARARQFGSNVRPIQSVAPGRVTSARRTTREARALDDENGAGLAFGQEDELRPRAGDLSRGDPSRCARPPRWRRGPARERPSARARRPRRGGRAPSPLPRACARARRTSGEREPGSGGPRRSPRACGCRTRRSSRAAGGRGRPPRARAARPSRGRPPRRRRSGRRRPAPARARPPASRAGRDPAAPRDTCRRRGAPRRRGRGARRDCPASNRGTKIFFEGEEGRGRRDLRRRNAREGGGADEERRGRCEKRHSKNARHRRARSVARAQPQAPQHLSKKIFRADTQAEEAPHTTSHPDRRPKQNPPRLLPDLRVAEEDRVDPDRRRRRERERRGEPPLLGVAHEGERPRRHAVAGEEAAERQDRRGAREEERRAAAPVAPGRRREEERQDAEREIPEVRPGRVERGRAPCRPPGGIAREPRFEEREDARRTHGPEERAVLGSEVGRAGRARDLGRRGKDLHGGEREAERESARGRRDRARAAAARRARGRRTPRRRGA